MYKNRDKYKLKYTEYWEIKLFFGKELVMQSQAPKKWQAKNYILGGRSEVSDICRGSKREQDTAFFLKCNSMDC